MSKKMTSEIALDMVTRIEALNDQISAVYREASDYDGGGNVNLIRDIVKARKAANDEKMIAEALLAAVDEEESA
ncbi:MAG: hypothetical protein AB7I42_25175 [Bradyrhizobium sp.]|uniref:GapR family DNA-binding domain-containing protein n=1 Tax=Bradyrhizobium sp. TaxID=376 RepID=UPI003D13B588